LLFSASEEMKKNHYSCNAFKIMRPTIPKRMLAARVNPTGDSVFIEEVDVPRPGKGEVLIQMRTAPIHPSDMARVRELSPQDAPNYIPGIEGCGTVVAAGPGVLPRFYLGKRVACFAKHKHSGTWAQYMVTTAGSCFPVKKAVEDEQAAMTIVNPLTALAFIDMARKHKHAAIINSAASGAVGKMMIYLGRKYRIPVINIVRSEEGVKILKQEGCDHVVNTSDPNYLEQIKNLISQLNASLMLDAVGGALINPVLDILPVGARVILYGNLSKEEVKFLPTQLVREAKVMEGFFLGHWISEAGMMATLRNLIRARKMQAAGFRSRIREVYELKDLPSAIDQFETHMSSGKLILRLLF
jgi:NADPH:quinone reductase-like Zn-dependent oxidoreductase